MKTSNSNHTRAKRRGTHTMEHTIAERRNERKALLSVAWAEHGRAQAARAEEWSAYLAEFYEVK